MFQGGGRDSAGTSHRGPRRTGKWAGIFQPAFLPAPPGFACGTLRSAVNPRNDRKIFEIDRSLVHLRSVPSPTLGLADNSLSNEQNDMKKLITLALGLAFSATAFAGDFADITVKDLKKAIAEKTVTVIDVNGSDSYKAGHIPTAINYEKSADTLEKSLPADKGALVVAYCGGPKCNAYQAAAKKAKELGYTNVKHLSAGISGWKEAGEKTEVAAK